MKLLQIGQLTGALLFVENSTKKPETLHPWKSGTGNLEPAVQRSRKAFFKKYKIIYEVALDKLIIGYNQRSKICIYEFFQQL